MDQPPVGKSHKVHFSDALLRVHIHASLVISAYHLSGTINVMELSVLLDTGVVVTLLCEDVG